MGYWTIFQGAYAAVVALERYRLGPRFKHPGPLASVAVLAIWNRILATSY